MSEFEQMMAAGDTPPAPKPMSDEREAPDTNNTPLEQTTELQVVSPETEQPLPAAGANDGLNLALLTQPSVRINPNPVYWTPKDGETLRCIYRGLSEGQIKDQSTNEMKVRTFVNLLTVTEDSTYITRSNASAGLLSRIKRLNPRINQAMDIVYTGKEKTSNNQKVDTFDIFYLQ